MTQLKQGELFVIVTLCWNRTVWLIHSLVLRAKTVCTTGKIEAKALKLHDMLRLLFLLLDVLGNIDNMQSFTVI